MSTADGSTTTPSTPEKPAPAKQKPKRSPIERVLFWGFIVVSLGLVAFEARAKFGYDMTVKYLNERLATEVFEIPKKGEKEEKVTLADPTWQTIQAEPFESASIAAGIMSGSASELRRFKPIVSRHADGTEVEIRDKDGNVLEVQPELNVERTIRWHSLRDLWEPQPAYQLTVVLASDKEDADIVAFDTDGGKDSLGDYFKNPERLAPSTYDPNQERSLAGPGGPPRPSQAPDDDEEKKADDTDAEKQSDGDEKKEDKAGDDSEAKSGDGSEVSEDETKEEAKATEKKSEEDGV